MRERGSAGVRRRAEILRSVISEKGHYSLFLTISLFYELASLQWLFKYVYCVGLLVCVCALTQCVFRGKLSVSFSLMRVDTVSRGNLFTYVQLFLPL